MKKTFAVCCLILLLFSSCQKITPPPTPVYDTPPVEAPFQVAVNGTFLDAVYLEKNEYYMRGDQLLSLIGGTAQAQTGIETHSLTVTVNGQDTVYTAGGEAPNAYFDGEYWYLPYEQWLEEAGYHYYEDPKGDRYYTLYPKAETLYKGAKVPVLMYHAVSDDLWGIAGLFVSPANMEKQLQYLADNGYTPIWFEDLAHIETIEKPVILTFDDGYDDNYTNLFPLLKKYNMKATVFMITGSIGATRYLTAEQIKEMNESGLVSFQSHTVSHPDLGKCTAEELDTEMLESKATLARLTGKEPFVLCYPMGKWSELSLEKTAEHYEYGIFMTGKTFVTGETDRVRVYRKYIARSTTLNEFAGMLK